MKLSEIQVEFRDGVFEVVGLPVLLGVRGGRGEGGKDEG
jgi:hypothetical protein